MMLVDYVQQGEAERDAVHIRGRWWETRFHIGHSTLSKRHRGLYSVGNFYTSYTLRGPTREAVAAALAGRSAIVTPERTGCIVVFDEQSESQNWEIIAGLASRLSRELRCPVLAVLNHDDEIFQYQLYVDGRWVDEYSSSSAYFEGEPFDCAGGDARALCRAFGVANFTEVEDILRASDNGEYIFAFERHADLVRALGIPPFGVCRGYHYVSRGELPCGLEAGDLLEVK